MLVARIPITVSAVELAVKLTRATRPTIPDAIAEVKRYVRFGAGPRGSQALVLAAKARAAMKGEAAADVEDVLDLAVPALRHRLVLGYRAEADGISDQQILMDVGKSCGVTLAKH
jgi:MoxR-like ATPase